MKLYIPLLVILFSALIIGAEGELPKSSTDILVNMERDISKIRAKAITALEKDMVIYTKKGDLVTAMAIKTKIESLKENESDLLGEGTSKGISIDKTIILFSVMYGVEGNEIDITKEVGTAWKKDGGLTIGNSIKGDPANGMLKRSLIKYSYNGKTVEKQFRENTSVTIDMLKLQ